LNDFFFGDGDPIHLNPFREIDQVGGGIEAYPVALFLKDRSDHDRRRSLSVRSSDVDRLNLFVGVPDGLQDPGDLRQAEYHSKFFKSEKVVQGLRVVIGAF
jgi:hypothetical protein